jgi:hypothetical protein
LAFGLLNSSIEYIDRSAPITQFIDFYFCEKIMSLLKIFLTLATITLAAGTPAFAAEPTSTNDIKQTTVIDGSNNSSSNSSYQTQRGSRSGDSRTPAISQKTDQFTDIQGNGNHSSNTSKQVVGGATQRRGR